MIIFMKDEKLYVMYLSTKYIKAGDELLALYFDEKEKKWFIN